MMTPLVIALPDDLKVFLDKQVVRSGYQTPDAYVAALLSEARAKTEAEQLLPLMLAGLAGNRVPFEEAGREGVFVSQSALDDVQAACEHFIGRGLSMIADRFRGAAQRAMMAAVNCAPGSEPSMLDETRLEGLRAWPVRGFSEHRVFALPYDREPVVLRVLQARPTRL